MMEDDCPLAILQVRHATRALERFLVGRSQGHGMARVQREAAEHQSTALRN